MTERIRNIGNPRKTPQEQSSGLSIEHLQLRNEEFTQIQQLMHRVAGLHLHDSKEMFVSGRLIKRVLERQCSTFCEYIQLIQTDKSELQNAIDLLTTHETYFFREEQHFEFLQNEILPQLDTSRGPVRIWSAACSSGEEPYSIAMTLAERLGERPWEVVASDISTMVLQQAKSGHYKMAEVEELPKHLLHKYCLRGIGCQEGTVLVSPKIRDRVHFHRVNLNKPLPALGKFDVIFLRNVMIYFNMETKQELLKRLNASLKQEGYLFTSHSETLNGVFDELSLVRPSIYRKIPVAEKHFPAH